MQGRGEVNPSPGTGEVGGLERSIDRISLAEPSTRPEAKRLGGLAFRNTGRSHKGSCKDLYENRYYLNGPAERLLCRNANSGFYNTLYSIVRSGPARVSFSYGVFLCYVLDCIHLHLAHLSVTGW